MYDQIDGVAMGSRLAPVLANLFLGYYENLFLNNYKGPAIDILMIPFEFLTMSIKHSSLC